MKTKNLILLVVALVLFSTARSQTLQDSIEIKKVALQYISSWNEGDSAKMYNALHPMLHKLNSKNETTDARALSEITSRCYGCHSHEFNIHISILDMKKLEEGDFLISAVKIESDAFIDYVTISKNYGEYLITDVLWDYKTNKNTGKTANIKKTIINFHNAVINKDIDAVQQLTMKEFNSGQAKCYFVVERYDRDWMIKHIDGLTEGFVGNRKQDIKILDTYNGLLASAVVHKGDMMEYYHLAFVDGKWKIANISRNYYTKLRQLELCTNIIDVDATAGEIIGTFDTRLHYNGDIKEYSLTVNDKKTDNKYFSIKGDKLILQKDARNLQSPLTIKVQAISNFDDNLTDEFILNIQK